MAGNNNKHAIWALLLTFTSTHNYIWAVAGSALLQAKLSTFIAVITQLIS